MGYANKRETKKDGLFWDARYKADNGKYQTILDTVGKPVRYSTPEAAQMAADRAEIEFEIRSKLAMPTAHPTPVNDPDDQSFDDFVNEWLDGQDLAETTMVNYECHIQCHLLPTFGHMGLKSIKQGTVTAWETKLRKAGYAPHSIRTYRAVLHVILEDALDEQKIPSNPAKHRRGRGQRRWAEGDDAPAKVITDAFGALLIAERMALLSGRDDEFVFELVKFYTGMRFSELRGLEVEFVRDGLIDVQWQLVEVNGRWIRRRPKGGRTRKVHLPGFLWHILVDFIARTQPRPCACHGRTYVFRGHGKRRGRNGDVTLGAIAQRLGIGVGTVSRAMRPDCRVAEATRRRVREVAAELGYVAWAELEVVEHYRRERFREALFMPAVSGIYPKHGKTCAHPVPISTAVFPGVPIRGRDAGTRADGVWEPIAEGMTPHGNRRSHRTNLVELGTPQKLIDARIGHRDPSVQGIYTVVTQFMIDKLMRDLTDVWTDALEKRLAICPTSPVPMMNDLLQKRASESRRQDLQVAV
ncbi:LacI family DNA-binding transcriptional regulator [Nocardia sp. NPDC050630]|uniref:LacI family DNA-binding transcriptional regulator n=1 Tax=Nocardia sp. NPDC050630 TaxID=3364321 RepID=UPI0037B0FEBF